jgi:hypothetical protein
MRLPNVDAAVGAADVVELLEALERVQDATGVTNDLLWGAVVGGSADYPIHDILFRTGRGVTTRPWARA